MICELDRQEVTQKPDYKEDQKAGIKKRRVNRYVIYLLYQIFVLKVKWKQKWLI